jgi:DNA ligase-1
VQFSKLVQTSTAVAATAARKQKIAALAALLGEVPAELCGVVVAYLIGELPQGKIGVGFAALRGALAQANAAAATLGVADVAPTRRRQRRTRSGRCAG